MAGGSSSSHDAKSEYIRGNEWIPLRSRRVAGRQRLAESSASLWALRISAGVRGAESPFGNVAGLVHLPELPQRVLLRVPLGPPRSEGLDSITVRRSGRAADSRQQAPGLCSSDLLRVGAALLSLQRWPWRDSHPAVYWLSSSFLDALSSSQSESTLPRGGCRAGRAPVPRARARVA